ncbi:protein of unknown function DUF2505 [Gordonia polyisoprenivorans VH2]|uniref:DUF2505 domain-containing protein n=2 Tax=Gordonia polyisoprenivorans TaxID=84595 RepID=H6MZP0_GORPV|nr:MULTISPECIES: DUF2505 domain-containing protein [Gordonia]AFA72027.1 protein of unknown function DUF2505 [Gordonia polyisoprenivorans VH2]MBE7192558.1 DUF2505 domain-containing protein [Gordonia polyisoprenivorans]MDF3280833.1 DUF2505 domain-containing protein [Gordonia sp. N1V]NKY00207.1 DUF2505 domain-containing protein [Gordonia polyisoprenivorans]OZC33867.1 DUF2505 domain-containing protein [Gordonia polyisoprenivorans]
MARRLSYSARYAHPVEKLYEAQSSRQYWDDMMAGFQMISPHCEVEDFRSDETGLKVVLKQHIGRDQLPPIAQTVLMKDMVITREESFGPFDPDNTKGNYTASIPAGPGNLQGWQELFPTETGCTIRKTTEVKVFIPFINGKLEQLMLVNLVDLFRAEAEYSKDWIDKNL